MGQVEYSHSRKPPQAFLKCKAATQKSGEQDQRPATDENAKLISLVEKLNSQVNQQYYVKTVCYKSDYIYS